MHKFDQILIQEIKRDGSICEMTNGRDLRMKVTVVNEETFAISFYLDGNKEEKSYTVQEKQEQRPEVQIAEQEDLISIRTASLILEIDRTYLKYRFLDSERHVIASSYREEPVSLNKDGGFRLALSLREEECLYGLGEDNDVSGGSLNRRGSRRDMITGQRINRNHVTADFPVPFLLSLGRKQPYAIYVDNTYRLDVDLGKTKHDCLSVAAAGGPCRFYFFSGKSVSRIHENYMKLIGMPALPPLWALGFMQSKCSFQDWDELDDVLYRYKEAEIPLDCIVFDFDWVEYFNNYKWHPRWKGLSPEKISQYRKEGIHFMVSNSGPMLKKNADTFESALEAGVLARDDEGNTITCGHYSGELIDFTNPDTEKWIEPQLTRVLDDGVEGWWLDLTEPEGDSPNTMYFAGRTEKIHNLFSNFTADVYHRVSEKHNPGRRSFVLTRTGVAGIQRKPTAVWTGDVYSEYGTFEAHIPEALNTGLSGIPMWTSDTGGFISTTNNDRYPYNLYQNDIAAHSLLYERWMQFSCFTPIMRVHHAGGEAVPFCYTELMVNGLRHYIRLRYQLLPYIYSAYYESHLHGTPIMRPMFWHYSEDRNTYDLKDQYLFGEWLLVAPVIREETDRREVYLPEGTWYDWDYGHQYEGGQTIEVFAPQNRIPVFVREGAILPMVSDMRNTDEMSWERIEVQIYPGARLEHTEYTMYADDGHSTEYLDDVYTETRFVCGMDGDQLQLRMERNNDLFPTKELILHIHTNRIPETVFAGGRELTRFARYYGVLQNADGGYCYDAFKQLLDIRVFWVGGADGRDDSDVTDGTDAAEDSEVTNGSDTMGSKSTVQIVEVDVCFDPVQKLPEKLPFMGMDGAGQLPFIYPASTIPCRIPAENYDRGGEGIAFHKEIPAKSAVYREDNADIVEAEGKQNYFIHALSKEEWLEYSIICGEEGEYSAALNYRGRAEIAILLNSQLVTGHIRLDSEEFTEAAIARIHITKGEHVLGIRVYEGTLDLKELNILL